MEEPWNPNLSKPNSAEFRALAAKVSAAVSTYVKYVKSKQYHFSALTRADKQKADR